MEREVLGLEELLVEQITKAVRHHSADEALFAVMLCRCGEAIACEVKVPRLVPI
ncbi:MAG: hypothetical protein JW751_30730 [Polyangiaceae bacterium]|nr:hypothetical protein [Polyangiaceae bacterium]